MRTYPHPLLRWTAVLLLLFSLCACSQKVLQVTALPEGSQEVQYSRGLPSISSAALRDTVGAGFMAYNDDKALVQVVVRNDLESSLLFGPENISVELLQASGNSIDCGVYTFEELASQGDSSFAWDGISSAMGIVGSLIPGGIGSAVASSAVQIGIKEGKRAAAEPKELTVAEIKGSYLRPHTVTSGSEYRGLLKIDITHNPKPEDVLKLTVNVRDNQEYFSFRFLP